MSSSVSEPPVASAPEEAVTPKAPASAPPRRDIEVTVALAEAGYLFSMYSSEHLGVFWELPFGSSVADGFTVELQVHGEFLVLIGDPKVGKPDDALCRALFDKNGQILSARIGLNSAGEVIVLSHFQRELLTASQLQYHVRNVVDTIAEVQRLGLKDVPPGAESSSS
jgi:hypothetical protein